LARAKSDYIVHLFALFGTHKHALVLHLSHTQLIELTSLVAVTLEEGSRQLAEEWPMSELVTVNLYTLEV
jgi:hypothetical protein